MVLIKVLNYLTFQLTGKSGGPMYHCGGRYDDVLRFPGIFSAVNHYAGWANHKHCSYYLF